LKGRNRIDSQMTYLGMPDAYKVSCNWYWYSIRSRYIY